MLRRPHLVSEDKENSMMPKSLIYALPLFMLFPLGLLAQESIEEQAKKIDRYINEAVSVDAFSGTVLLTKDGQPIYEKAAGEASKSYKISNNINTRFNIGSIGKIFTATAIMQLAQSGRLNLNDTIDKYLPDFPYAEKNEITIQQLLNHSAGLGDYFEHPDFYAKKENLREISYFLSLVYEMKLIAKPGEKFHYSNSRFVLLGAIIEKVSGQLYRTYIDERIFEPLDMKDTEIVYIEDIVPDMATGYYPKNADELQLNIFVQGRACSAGGIYHYCPQQLFRRRGAGGFRFGRYRIHGRVKAR
jgi:CubicO group peptidase (beta-lactamase class C family)